MEELRKDVGVLRTEFEVFRSNHFVHLEQKVNNIDSKVDDIEITVNRIKEKMSNRYTIITFLTTLAILANALLIG